MAKEVNGTQKPLLGKLLIEATLKIVTGMHIGGSSDYAPIGAVDSPFVRDLLTHKPIIPGSSIKGKMRTLQAKNTCTGYVLHGVNDDNEVIKRLYGSSGKDADGRSIARPARLQFFDLFVTDESEEKFNKIDTDTYIGEVKFENTINRSNGVANPRQIERVPAGVEFAFKLVYNVESMEELEEDMQALATGMELLQTDYLGGHGSRGYGRVALHDFNVKTIGKLDVDAKKYSSMFEGTGL